jgi:hypothetical protein
MNISAEIAKTEILQVEWSKRQAILIEKIQDALCSFDINDNQFNYIPMLFSLFAYSLVDERVIRLSNEYIKLCYRRGWTIYALFSPLTSSLPSPLTSSLPSPLTSSLPSPPNTLYIVYGNYPHSVEALPTPNSPLYRHPLYFAEISQYHTHVDSHPVWSNIDGPIYILTTGTRLDRYAHILLELCKVKAPLNRVIKYCGGWMDYTGDKNHDRYICASVNHEEVCTHFLSVSSSSSSEGGIQVSPPAPLISKTNNESSLLSSSGSSSGSPSSSSSGLSSGSPSGSSSGSSSGSPSGSSSGSPSGLSSDPSSGSSSGSPSGLSSDPSSRSFCAENDAGAIAPLHEFRAEASPANYCLVLEDDFSFIDDVNHIHNSLQQFFENIYKDFYVCFLSYSKYGNIEDIAGDSLIKYSKQWCTTSSGYILQRSTAGVIQETHREAIEKMKQGESANIYCCDRYWCKYGHENKMIVFGRKLGFQYITHSDIVNKINIHFD